MLRYSGLWIAILCIVVGVMGIHQVTGKDFIHSAPVLVIDAAKNEALPKNFRAGSTPFQSERVALLKRLNVPVPPREGLDDLRLSASAQFSEKELKALLDTLPKGVPIYIVDLRQESHGFLNGHAVSWFGVQNHENHGLSQEEVLKKEGSLLQRLQVYERVLVHQIKEKTQGFIKRVMASWHPVLQSETEAQVLKKYGVHYVRLTNMDRLPPEDKRVQEFIAFLKELPDDAWVHIHCRGGRGRATFYMIVADMVKNGQTLPLHDLIRRQYLIGGKSLDPTIEHLAVSRHLQAKRQLLKKVYENLRRPSETTPQQAAGGGDA